MKGSVSTYRNWRAVYGNKSDSELRQRELGAFALLSMLFLRDSRRPECLLEKLIKWSDLLQQVLQESEGRRAILQLLSYLAIVVPELDLQTLIIKVRQASPEASEVVMTLAEQLIEQGKTQGFNDGKIQGFNDGKTQGQRELVRRLLEKKFGQLPTWACEKLASASEELLENYLDRLVTTSSLSEVLGN